MYAGIVVGKGGKVPYHVKDGYEIAVYNSDTARIERKITLKGINDEKRPGQIVAGIAVDEGLDRLYTGRALSVFGLSRWKLILQGIRNKAGSGRDLGNIVTELHQEYQPQNLAPAYAH